MKRRVDHHQYRNGRHASSHKNVAVSLFCLWICALPLCSFLLQVDLQSLPQATALLNSDGLTIGRNANRQSSLLIFHSHACSTESQTLVTTIAEDVWRTEASNHRTKIQDLLQPGLVGLDHDLMKPLRKKFQSELESNDDPSKPPPLTMLDPKHPIYNFLVEYYGLKGLKGPKRLARWAPSVGLFFWQDEDSQVRRIQSMEDYNQASQAYLVTAERRIPNGKDDKDRQIFLEGATPDDFALTLYLQGAEWVESNNNNPIYSGTEGILYRPIRHYTDDSSPENGDNSNAVSHNKATSFVWYKSILETTLSNEPVLHCYGLHEWAMQYHPEGAPPPPSGKYQKHLPLRVSRDTINRTVERKGLRCTHVDALRFFAPAAGPLNHHGASLERAEQLELEQPGCVHAHMDLLKIALRIKPYCDPELLVQVLEMALEARTLDVGASPYDCSAYGYGTNLDPIRIIPVETTEGRALYKELQEDLMHRANIVRKALLANYEAFGAMAFETQQLVAAVEDPSDERFAKAEPGGRAWRQNLIERPSSTGE